MLRLTGLLLSLGLIWISECYADPNCSLNSGLIVYGKQQRLLVCENSRVIHNFRVALGTRGLGKTRALDKKTPLGLYDLGQARPSSRFETFIPIAYPTLQQVKQGYTGSAVGIHGPYWLFGLAGEFNTLFNWTQGCVALASQAEISTLALWLKQNPEAKILLQP